MAIITLDNGGKSIANSETYKLSQDITEIVKSLNVVTICQDQAHMDSLDLTDVSNRVCLRVDQMVIYVHNGSTWKRQTPAAGAGPFAMAAGTASAIMGTVNSLNFAVNFPSGRFTQPPIVTLGKSMSTNAAVQFSAINVTASGFIMNAHHVGGGDVSQSVACMWTAVQMTPTSGAG